MQESILETNKDMGDSEQQQFDDQQDGVADAEHYDKSSDTNLGGGKKKRKSRRKTRHMGTKNKRRSKKSKKSKKSHKKGPSKWISHVKAFCKRTGKTFPEALKDPMCRKSFRH